MKRINVIGTEHMAESLIVCLEKMGNTIVSAGECDICWIAIDTPVNKEGKGNIKPIYEAIIDVKPHLKDGVLVVVSSQIPVGTSEDIIKLLEGRFKYAYMPEHMRTGKGVDDFMNLEVIVMGIGCEDCKEDLRDIFQGMDVVFTNVVTAEMIKHANNAFLATSLCFIYDIADVCEAVGADVTVVAKALRSDHRIGKEAYLDASAGFSGGHLERDLDYLQKVAKSKNVDIPVIDAVMKKNTERRNMIIEKLGDVKDKKIAFWGITYKPGALPSNNSLPAKLMRDMTKMGAQLFACDPMFADTDPYNTVEGCMAVICITPWEELKELDFKKVSESMVEPKILFDARNYFAELEDVIKDAGIEYVGVGR